jgi:hypothetical protein
MNEEAFERGGVWMDGGKFSTDFYLGVLKKVVSF